MKIAFLSDLHGHLPKMEDEYDVVCIAGDIVPLEIQNDVIKSVVWFSSQFVQWAMKIRCGRVFFVAGNHDRFLEEIVKDYFSKRDRTIYTEDDKESLASAIIKERLLLPKKIVYLQDNCVSYNRVWFYGSPWCKDLVNWAFYKRDEDLKKTFEKIPDKCDVLITHMPGTENDMGTSLWLPYLPEFGCKELTDKVNTLNIKVWAAGHIHTGNHKEFLMSNGITRAINVSLKDEDYIVRWEPTVIEI